jgi:RNA exonuclease 1
MGTSKSGDSELIRVTMIDYFSSAVLVDSLVYPDVEMDHLNTRYSGVTWKQMKEALQTNKCLLGQKAARKAVWKFVGPDTVVVGHSPHNDLTAMRWIHHTVVDTYLIDYLKAREKMIEEKMAEEKRTMEQKAMEATGQNVAEPVPTPALPIEKDQQAVPKRPKGSGNLALKTMTLEKLGRKIQMGGNKGHDSLEDAIASRDLAHWNVLRGAEIRDEDAAAEYLCEDGGVRL